MILIIDDESSFRELYSDTLSKAGFQVKAVASVAEAKEIIKKSIPKMIISDVRMPGVDGISFLKEIKVTLPDLPVLLITAYADVREAVNALKFGAVDYLEKPVDLDELVVAVEDTLRIESQISYEFEIPKHLVNEIIAVSDIMKSLLRDAYRIAQSDVNVLLLGESGTGKEVFANFIYKASKRCNGPFVAVNCAAIPHHLLATELFGHRKGAFTGALTDRTGKFREADKGILFLDEIGDMPLELQPALLRVIETGKVTPVGMDQEVSVDFRLIAASNKNLLEASEENKFRKDLYYRVSVITIELPPLREHREDIIPLAKHFLAKLGKPIKRLSPLTTDILRNYSWPGNVRELANAIERAKILSSNEIILPEHLPPTILQSTQKSEEALRNYTLPDGKVKTISEIEKEAILAALKTTGGNKTKAAKMLKISRRALIYKLKRMGI